MKMRILTMEGDEHLNSYQAKQLPDYIARILFQLSKTSKSRERLMKHMRGNVIYTKAVFRLDAEGYSLSDITVELSVSEEQVREILEE